MANSFNHHQFTNKQSTTSLSQMFDGHDQADFDRRLLDFVKAPVDDAILYSIPLMTTRQIKENIINAYRPTQKATGLDGIRVKI